MTNRHIADPRVDGRRVEVRGVYLRLNRKQPIQGQESFEVPLQIGPQTKWYFPNDETVDLAAFPLTPDLERVDLEPIPRWLFATRQTIKSEVISEGDRLLLTGFFYQFPGERKIQPILSQGILAMLPDENLKTTLGKDGHLYLAELHIFGGNSGSPVFVDLNVLRGRTLRVADFPYRLLGVVSGYFFEDQEFNLRVSTTLTGDVKANSGVSAVVPAEELKALLDLPELQAVRDAEIARQDPRDKSNS